MYHYTKLSFLSVKNTFKKACGLEILGSSKKFVGRNIFSVKSFVSSSHFYHFSSISSMCKKCPYSEFFWSVFFRIWTEYGEMLRISPYPVQMRENTGSEKLRIRTFFTQWLSSRCKENRRLVSTGIMVKHQTLFLHL